MMRTLQLAGVHGWVSLRLSVSRGYWLPRLTLAFIAGYMLLFSARYDEAFGGWGLVTTSFIVGGTCISLWTFDGISKTIPLPLPRSWRTTVSVLIQILLCVVFAFGFMMNDIATSYAAALSVTGTDWQQMLSQPVPHVLQAHELQNLALMVMASIPFGLVAAQWMEHSQDPQNQLPNLRWQSELPRWYGALALAAVVVMGLTALQVTGFTLQYATVWAGCIAFMTSVVTVGLGWIALFPPSEQQARTAQPAGRRLVTTVGRSQAIKWSLFLGGFVLYWVNPGAYLPEDWAIRSFRGRPLYGMFAAMLPLFSMLAFSNGHSNDGTHRTFSSTWAWNRSGWQMVPIPRAVIQRTLMIDMVGFATVSTVGMHIALILVSFTTGNGAPLPWVEDLTQFTWLVTMAMGFMLPLCLMLFLPRRRFGLGLTLMALISVFWGLRNGVFFEENMNLGGALALKQHLIAVACWGGMAAVFWAQTGSAHGRLFETSTATSQWPQAVANLIGAKMTRWSVGTLIVIATLSTIVVHRNAVSAELERRQAAYITPAQTDRLIKDIERVAQMDVLQTTTRERDAGSILNPHIGLDDGTSAETDAWWDDPEHKYKFKRLGSPWFEVPDGVDVELGDLSILTTLLDFDHWETGRLPNKDTPGVGAYASHLQTVRGQTYLHWGGPFPNMVALVDLAKMRLLQGLKTKDILPALKEVRHLAKLIYSDETLISTMVAIGILRNEQRVYTSAVENGLLAPTDWEAIPIDELNRMHRVAISLDYVMAGGADEAQWKRIAELPIQPFALCGAIHESITMAMSQPAISFWPAELFPLPKMGFVTHAISNSDCTTPLARHDHQVYLSETPLDGLFRNRSWHQLLAKEFGENMMLKLTIPYLRGQAWMEIEEGQNMRSILMYGATPKDDWNGPQTTRKP